MNKHEKYQIVFESKVSYGLRFRYIPFSIAFLFIVIYIISFYLSLGNEKYYYPIFGQLGLLLFPVEFILMKVLSLYRRTRIYNHNESFILQISEANKVLFAKEFQEIEYWWNYQSMHLGKVVTPGGIINENSKLFKGTDFNIFSSTKPRSLGKSLPDTLFVKFIFHDEEVVLYEALGYFDDIPSTWNYKNDINDLHAESYKLEKCVKIINDLKRKTLGESQKV